MIRYDPTLVDLITSYSCPYIILHGDYELSLCLPPLGSGDIIVFHGRPSVCLSVTNRVRSIA